MGDFSFFDLNFLSDFLANIFAIITLTFLASFLFQKVCVFYKKKINEYKRTKNVGGSYVFGMLVLSFFIVIFIFAFYSNVLILKREKQFKNDIKEKISKIEENTTAVKTNLTEIRELLNLPKESKIQEPSVNKADVAKEPNDKP